MSVIPVDLCRTPHVRPRWSYTQSSSQTRMDCFASRAPPKHHRVLAPMMVRATDEQQLNMERKMQWAEGRQDGTTSEFIFSRFIATASWEDGRPQNFSSKVLVVPTCARMKQCVVVGLCNLLFPSQDLIWAFTQTFVIPWGSFREAKMPEIGKSPSVYHYILHISNEIRKGKDQHTEPMNIQPMWWRGSILAYRDAEEMLVNSKKLDCSTIKSSLSWGWAHYSARQHTQLLTTVQ